MTIIKDGSSERDARNHQHNAAAFSQVLIQELKLIDERRRVLLDVKPPDDPATASTSPPDEFARAQRRSPLGLSFSGGGIRSATFNLGVLQALAEKDLLRYVDYLSTVSGGGYIGSWLHGVMYRRVADAAAEERKPLDDVQRKAIAQAQMARAQEALKSGIRQVPGPADQDPITFLRKYSNYLAPRPGLFSADTWTIGFIWLRNVLLNQLILVPAIAALVAATLLVVLVVQWQPFAHSERLGIDVISSAAALLCLIGAIAFMVRELRSITERSFTAPARTAAATRSPSRRISNSTIVVGLVSLTLLFLGVSHFELYSRTHLVVSAILIALMATIQYAGGYVECHVRSHGNRLAALWDVLWMSTVSGALAGFLVTLAWQVMTGSGSITNAWPPYYHLAFGPPLIGIAFVVSVMLLVGLMGADYPDAAREWTARTGSTLAIVTSGWLVWFALAVFGPWLVTKIVSASTMTAIGGIVAWISTTIGGVLAGRSARSAEGSTAPTARPLKLLVAIAPTIFLIGYIIAIAAAVHALVPPAYISTPSGTESPGAQRQMVNITAPEDNSVQLVIETRSTSTLESVLQPVADFGSRYPGIWLLSPTRQGFSRPSLDTEGWTQLDWLLVVFGVSAIVAFIASRRINVNEFSLHHFYKNRLVRCYLGASNAQRRRPNPATGFDPSDDVPIAKLRSTAEKDPYYGPYALINAALNLNAGSELATQERKATSFVFSPEYCGFSTRRMSDDGGKHEELRFGDAFEANGYRPTVNYSYAHGPNVGTAVAISGAAANPNWGYHTSGPMAFLLTVFNARLGWWLGNPRWRLASRTPGPKFALRYLFSELLGQTTGQSQYVNLSDGGHFDNLGLYELVQRRCRFIIVCDAEEDHDLTFGSLGGAIRKCRADFGVEIDIDTAPIRQSADGFSKAHCVVGTILYPEKEAAFSAGPTSGIGPADSSNSRGWLIYLKSSLTGDEPADVLEYRSQFPEFPHQSTGDQFFSESQFESYRRLGYHVCRSAFAGVTVDDAVFAGVAAATDQSQTKALLATYPMVALFQEMTRKWYAPIPVSAEAATRLANAYVELMQRIAKDDKLKELNEELTSGKPVTRTATEASAAEIAAGMDLMQLVQNVYTEFNFETAFNRANPRNSGWMSVFRKWRKSPILSDQIWPHIRNDYHSLFQTFVDKRLVDEGMLAERP
jgi:hypothetical protein